VPVVRSVRPVNKCLQRVQNDSLVPIKNHRFVPPKLLSAHLTIPYSPQMGSRRKPRLDFQSNTKSQRKTTAKKPKRAATQSEVPFKEPVEKGRPKRARVNLEFKLVASNETLAKEEAIQAEITEQLHEEGPESVETDGSGPNMGAKETPMKTYEEDLLPVPLEVETADTVASTSYVHLEYSPFVEKRRGSGRRSSRSTAMSFQQEVEAEAAKDKSRVQSFK